MTKTSPTYPIVSLPGFQPLDCLISPEEAAFATAQGAVIGLLIGNKRWLIADALLARADGLGMDKLYKATLDLCALVKRFGEGLGLGEPWRKAIGIVAEQTYGLWRRENRRRNQDEVRRRLESSTLDEAQALAGRITTLARGLLDWMGTLAEERKDYLGTLDALWKISDKAQIPALRQRLLAHGVTEEMLRRIDELAEALHAQRGRIADEEAEGAFEISPLRCGKAMLLGEITRVAALSRGTLPESTAEAFQIGRLLDLSARPASGRAPTPPTPVPPTPVAPTPVLTPVAPTPTLMAGPTPATPPPGTTSTAPAAPANSANHGATFGGMTLVPGTVLTVIPPGGGPALSVIVQPDGTIPALPGATTPSPVAPAPATTGPIAISTIAPATGSTAKKDTTPRARAAATPGRSRRTRR